MRKVIIASTIILALGAVTVARADDGTGAGSVMSAIMSWIFGGGVGASPTDTGVGDGA